MWRSYELGYIRRILSLGHCVGDCILCTKQVVDSGPGSPSVSLPRVVIVGDFRLCGWWPLTVAGGVSQFHVCSCRVRTYFVHVIKPPCYSVQRLRELFEFKVFIVYFCRVEVCRNQLGRSGYCREKWICPAGHIAEE